MKKITILVIICILATNCFSQIKFEKGYFINNDGQTVTCLVRNADWFNSPTEFQYKITDDSPIEKGNTIKVKEFGIANQFKYKRFDILFYKPATEENTGNIASNTSDTVTQQLFLKTLVEGLSSLYLYQSKNTSIYFFQTRSSEIKQLIYQPSVDNDNRVRDDNTFRNQLWNTLKCPAITLASIEKIRYAEKDLISLFVKYNSCSNSTFTSFKKKQKRDLFNLSFRPGINFSSLSIDNYINNASSDFNNKTGIRLGLEAEFILPFNKNKWALLIEPVYQSFKSESTPSSDPASIDYSSVEFTAGVRHYFFLNDASKIFLNVSGLYDFPINSVITRGSGIKLEINNRQAFLVGAGYKYKNKFSVEARYSSNGHILGGYSYWGSSYQTTSLVFGYTIF